MKSSTSVLEDHFVPFRMELTFETYNEALAMYALLNHPSVLGDLQYVLGGDVDQLRKVREQIRDVAQIPLFNGLTYPAISERIFEKQESGEN